MNRTITEKKVKVAELKALLKKELEAGSRPIMAYAHAPPKKTTQEIVYLINQGKDAFALWRCPLKKGEELPSLAQISPLLGWYEREMVDLYGVTIPDHPEPHPLVLHEGAKPSKPPFLQTSAKMMPFKAKRWDTVAMKDPDLQHLPFGPVRADVVESAEFDYQYAGEMIVHFEQKLFFKHRGMEQRFCGLDALTGVVIAERVSGTGSLSHALAYCQAVEAACGCEVPARALRMRVILAELERLYNHLGYFGRLCSGTTLKVGAAEGSLFEEYFKQLNAKVCGSRFLRSTLTPGGLRCELHLEALKHRLDELQKPVMTYLERLENSKTHIDRLIGTGVVPHEMALHQGATGPVERASNISHDLRREHAYAAYDELNVRVPVEQEGDAHARARVRAKEVEESFSLLRKALRKIPSGALLNPCNPTKKCEGMGWVETPRGGLFYAVHFDSNGLLQRVKIKSPSFSNWRVFPFTVHGTGIMDYAINEASFGLTISGCDR